MRKYTALEITVIIIRVLAVLTTAMGLSWTFLAASGVASIGKFFGSGPMGIGVVSTFIAGIVASALAGILVYALADFLYCVMDIAKNTGGDNSQ